jgi:hypothetical protein
VTLFGINVGSRTLGEAEHLVHDLVAGLGIPQGTVACTHLIRSGAAHIAVSVRLPPGADAVWERLTMFASTRQAGVTAGPRRLGPAELADAAAEAEAQHTARQAGRAVIYPGVTALAGTVTFGEVLAVSAITRVIVIGGEGEPGERDRLLTRDHVRPEWRDGALTLAITAVERGLFAPFEVPNPTPCCADHG